MVVSWQTPALFAAIARFMNTCMLAARSGGRCVLKYVEAILKPVDKLAEALNSKPEAALGGLAIVVPALLIGLGVNHWLAILGPLAVYLVYCVRAGFLAYMTYARSLAKLEQTQAEGERRIAELAAKYLHLLEAGTSASEREGNDR